MKKIVNGFALALLVLFFYPVQIAKAGVYLRFNFQGVTQAYVKFTYEFGVCFIPKAKIYPFSKDYKVEVLEGEALIRYNDRFEEELVIAIFINGEKSPFVWVKTRDLEGSTEQETEERIKKKTKEFSDRIFQRLLQLEKEKLEKEKPVKPTKKVIARP